MKTFLKVVLEINFSVDLAGQLHCVNDTRIS